MDQTRLGHQADDRLDGFENHFVGGSKCLMDSLSGQNQFAHAVVVKRNECVGKNRKLVERGFRLLAPSLSFEKKRHGGEYDDKRPFFTGDACDDGSSSRSGSSAKTDAEKNDFLTFQGGADFGFSFQHGLLTQIRIAAGSEAFGQIGSQLDLLFGERCAKGADVCIQGDEFAALEAVECDSLEHVRSGPSEADDFDSGCGDLLDGIA